MKKIITILAVLLVAVPAMAAVTITATPTPNSGQVVISYLSNEPINLRALALDIMVEEVGSSMGAPVITAVTPATIGETIDAGTRGFGIFPSTITIDENGDITDGGVPVSPVTKHVDTLPGIDSNGVTIEMAALYGMDDAATLAPAQSGTLCTLTVDHDCNLTITANSIRGGIVLNDGTYSQDPCSGTALSVTLPSNVEIRFEEEPGCACPGDVSGGTAGVPDGVISLPDITYIVGQLTQFGGKTRTIPMSDVAHYNLCADVSGSTAGEPDNAMSLPDITYIVGRLTAAGGKTRTIPCSTGLYP